MILAKSLLILIILLWLNRFNQVINLLNLKLVIDSELEYFDSIRIFLAKVELIKRNKINICSKGQMKCISQSSVRIVKLCN